MVAAVTTSRSPNSRTVKAVITVAESVIVSVLVEIADIFYQVFPVYVFK